MIGERFGEAPRTSRLRLLPLLALLLLAFALGGVTLAWWRGGPAACPAGSLAMPSSASTEPGESPTRSEVVPTPTPTVRTPTPSPTGPGPAASVAGGGTGVVRPGGAGFTITGSVSNLPLGVPTPIRLTLSNPNGVPIYVTALTVSVAADSRPPGCSSATNLQLAQSNVSAADPIVIPAQGRVTLTSAPRAPQITLRNLPGVNQDVCRGKSFVLTYTGSAHS